MSTFVLCPKCKARLPTDAPAGLCPKCLVQAGLASDVLEAVPKGSSPTSAKFEPPAVETLANCFPQLEILELIGQGGMGAVYKARQRGLDRIVAVKVLPPEVGRDPAFAERFTREARALARLNHPNIVAVHDFGRAAPAEQAQALFYFVMEFVDGANLRETIRAGGLSPQQALAIVPQICDALQYAHDEGFVHRDIKPENILLDKRGRVKIADFGLSKLISGDGRQPAEASLTGSHQVMGTLRYMAPEQMEGTKAVDHRADIFSLGVVFYEMLTGELPLGRFAPPSQKVQVDVRLDEVVLRSLEKEPERRYQHASDVKLDVEAISQARPAKPAIGMLPVTELVPASSPGPNSAALSGAHSRVAVLTSAMWRWSDTLAALSFLVPLFALFALAMWISGSAWVLAGLIVPWFGLGAAGGYYDGTPTEKTCAVVATISFLISVTLIAFGIWLDRSAYPLLAIAPGLVGFLAGIWIGTEGKSSETDSKTAADDQQAKKEEEEEEEEKEETPPEKLQQVAWFLGFIGAARTWALLPKLSGLLDKLLQGEAIDSPGQLLIEFTGPLILLAAVAMYHARFYWCAVVASVLCFATGNIMAIGAGVWSLLVLFDPVVRALFAANATVDGHAGVSRAATAKPLVPRGYGAALGSTLGNAWTEWWRERDALFTRAVQTILLLVHLACLIAFLSFSGSGGVNEQGAQQFKQQIGFPTPWYSIELTSGPVSSFHQSIQWSPAAWAVVAFAFAVYYVNWRIERVQNPLPEFWYKPATLVAVWGVLALLAIGLNNGLALVGANPDRWTTAVWKSGVSEAPRPASGAAATELIQAVIAGNVGRVKELLDAGASVNGKDPAGETLLMKAIAHGQRSLALTLVLLGADLSEQDQLGRSAMMLAVEQRDRVFLKRLRDLQQVAANTDESQRKVELRAFSGVERTLLDGRDFDLRNLDTAELESQTDLKHETAALKAARIGDWELLGLTATQPATLRIQDQDRRTIAMRAAVHGHVEWFEPLTASPYFGLAGGAYERNFTFVGPLACFQLEQLALRDIEGKTALQLAEQHGHQRIADILRAHLEAILAHQTSLIDQGGEGVAQHIRWRATARMALGQQVDAHAAPNPPAAPGNG